MATTTFRVPSLESAVSPAEWATRVDLAAAYRACALFGFDDMIWTHISARVPGEDTHFLINPYGLFFDEICASSLIKVDLDGRVVGDAPFEFNPAGVNIHSAILAARPGVNAVLHTHTLDGAAVASQKGGLLPISQPARLVLGNIAYHDYEGPVLDAAEKPRLVADLGDAFYYFLRNHGLIALGATIADAFIRIYRMEQACRIQIRAQAGGGELVHVTDEVLAGARGSTRPGAGKGYRLVWSAILRRLDRLDPSFRA